MTTALSTHSRRELMEWLRAQLDEDERIARGAPGPTWEHRQIRGDFDESVVFEDYVAVADPGRNAVIYSDVSAELLPFALRHDPARVLREIDAKRNDLRDLEQAEFTLSTSEPGTPPHDVMTGAVNTLRRIVRRHAEAYADRPGYRQEWRP